VTGAERRAERLVREAVGGFSVGAIHIAADESVIGWRAIAAMRIAIADEIEAAEAAAREDGEKAMRERAAMFLEDLGWIEVSDRVRTLKMGGGS